jgi:hypothetical protein
MRGTLYFLIVTLLLPLVAGAQTAAQSNQDPHRPACTTTRCRKIESFLKKHYCGASPFGNGPDDGCDIKSVERPQIGVDVIAEYWCEWNEKKEADECKQSGQPSSAVRALLVGELHRLGLPLKADGETHFTVWKSAHSGWTVAKAAYTRVNGAELDLCEVIGIIDEASHIVVVRKLPFHKTNVDVPDVTDWSLVDLADVESDGTEDVILQGDGYEDHWFEVVSIRGGAIRTIFSGLGYYL